MTSLHVGPIKKFALGIYDGPHATPKEADEGPIFLGIKNVTPQGTLDFSEIRHVSDQEYPKWTKRVVPQENDIVFSYEATLHRYALIPEGFRGCLGRRMALVRPDPTKVHPRFLHYYFLTASWRAVIEGNIISGATVDRVPLTKFPDFEVRLPALDLQKRIASILSAYDDLIENNRRRIQLLEQAARLLYKEWFVHLRFPGHEHVKITDGVPEGWERKKLSDLTFVVTKGTTPTTLGKTFVEEGVNFIKVESISNSGKIVKEKMARIDEETHELLKRSQLLEGDILFSIAGAIGRSAIVPKWVTPANTNQALAIIRPMNHETRHYLYWVVRSDSFLAYSMGRVVQTAQANVSLSALKAALITVPAEKIIKLFVEIVTPIHQQIDGLNSEVRLASEARDLLLPRLMNGEVVV